MLQINATTAAAFQVAATIIMNDTVTRVGILEATSADTVRRVAILRNNVDDHERRVVSLETGGVARLVARLEAHTTTPCARSRSYTLQSDVSEPWEGASSVLRGPWCFRGMSSTGFASYPIRSSLPAPPES